MHAQTQKRGFNACARPPAQAAFTAVDLRGPAPAGGSSKTSGEAQSRSLAAFGIPACGILLKVLAELRRRRGCL